MKCELVPEEDSQAMINATEGRNSYGRRGVLLFWRAWLGLGYEKLYNMKTM